MTLTDTEALPSRWTISHALSYGLVLAAAAILLIRFLAGVQAAAPLERQSACLALNAQRADRKAPPFQLKDLNGKEVSLASLRGKVVLVNFWATWCPPCVEEMPSMIKLAESPPEGDFVMLMVSVDDTAKEVTDFFARRFPAAKDLPILMYPGKKIASKYGTTKFPESYLIDAEGNIRYWFINKREWGSSEAKTCINSLL